MTDNDKAKCKVQTIQAKSIIALGEAGVETGQNRLFRWMRDNGYIMRYTNVPTQYSMERGLMEVKERAINNPDGSVRITQTIKVTGKGQAYFVNKFIGG